MSAEGPWLPAPCEGLTSRLRPPAPVRVSLCPCVHTHACTCADHVSMCEVTPGAREVWPLQGPFPLTVPLQLASGGCWGQPPTDLDHGVQPRWGLLCCVPIARLAGGGTHGGWSTGPRRNLGLQSGRLLPRQDVGRRDLLQLWAPTCPAPAPCPGLPAAPSGLGLYRQPSVRRCSGNRNTEGSVSMETGVQALLPLGVGNVVV